METARPAGRCPRALRELLLTLLNSGAPATSMADSRRASLASPPENTRTYSQMVEPAPQAHAPSSLFRSLSETALDVTVLTTTKVASSLGMGKKLAYSFLRMPLSSLDFTFRPARTAIWVDTLGQSLSSQASLISAVKSLDLLLGFTVGKASDNLRTPYGRRKPFILVLFPMSLLAFYAFVNAPNMGLGLSRPRRVGESPCVHLVKNASSPIGCGELKACLDAAIAAGELDRPDSTSALLSAPERSDGVTMSFFFALFYFLFLACCATGSQIPYDALGMELTEDYHERSSLFGIKTLFQFLGYAAAPALGLGLTAAYGDDLVALYSVQSFVFGGLALFAYVVLLGAIKERPLPADDHLILPVPFIPSARRVLANRPYLLYICMKLPLALFALMPSNLASLWVKHNMALEGWIGMYNYVLIYALLGGMGTIGILVSAAQRFGKKTVLVYVLLVEGAIYISVSLIPGAFFKENPAALIPVGMLIGVGQVLGFVLPDAMLADIIDYAELHSGTRDEGMYTVIETNLQQFVEIAGGVIPMLTLAAAGYVPLGGCTCGCGVSCSRTIGQPYARWHCPNNVGYSCTGTFGSELLYAPEPATAPCAAQDGPVQGLISFFFLAVPGLLAFIAAIPASRMPIDATAHAAIQAAVAARTASPGLDVIDPLDGKPVVLPPNTAESFVREHFSTGEWATFRSTKALRAFLCSRLALWLALVAALIALMVFSGVEAITTLGCLVLSALFVLIPWDAVRLYVISTAQFAHTASRGLSTGSTGLQIAT
mmetsp:Transcript_30750/g.94200  ORF Transcript_30750/g.94200 Transcript_30750/m.94200 type:complete len:773 (+) Transcript_30750:162-2480(+)